jgi:CPA2 family monovalent cation:H+ antiporter-2
MHDFSLIATLALGLSASLILGYAAQRLGLSPILGYLLAGIAIGPFTPGLVADSHIASQFAEMGVILLMFGVGLHFQLKDLLAVKSIALPGAIGQSLVATALGTLVGWGFGWGLGGGVVLGIAISVASTVVLIRGLTDRNALSSPEGHIAVGWLIVEDIFTVLVLVLLPVVTASLEQGSGGMGDIVTSMGVAILKLGIMGVVLLVGGGKVVPWLMSKVARTRSQELFTLAVLTFALVIAIASAYLFGASMALGAFLAGMVVGQSALSHQAAANALPMRDAFAVIFFVSVGMLFDPQFIFSQPKLVIAVLGIILIAKPIAALLIVILFGYSIRTALTVAVGLAQVGEFSFILAELARRLDVLPQEGYSVLVASALVSISLNPLLFKASDWVEARLRYRAKLWGLLSDRAEERGREMNTETAAKLARMEPDKVRAVVVGYGPVGKTLTGILKGFGIHPVIVDLNIDNVARLSEEGFSAIYGDAGNSDILKAAGVDRAKYLAITLPDLLGRIPVIVAARELNENLIILSRARYLAERATLEEFGVTEVCYEEAEAAVGLSECLLRAEGAEEQKISEESRRIRLEFALKKQE